MVDPKLTTSHSVNLSPKILIPGATFHFVVKGVDAQGILSASGDNAFTTLKTGSKKSSVMVAVLALVGGFVLVGIAGGALLWIKKGASKPQWSGYEPAVKSTGSLGSQIVTPVDAGAIKPGEDIINPGSGPKPPAPPA